MKQGCSGNESMKKLSFTAEEQQSFCKGYSSKVSSQITKIREDNKRAYEDARHIVLA